MDNFVPVVAMANIGDVTSKVSSNAEGGPQTRRVQNGRNHAPSCGNPSLKDWMRHLQVPTLQASVGKMLSDPPDDDRSFSVLHDAGRETP